MKRIPVYKACDNCKGTGEETYQQYHVDPQYSGNCTFNRKCNLCKGTGKIKTNMFIEDPYSLFDLSEEEK